jgi:glyoxylase-like metal-dependent hydrolase (beta-lactamase superfamily II)
MEIAEGIHRIQVPFADRFLCMYLLVGDEAAMLIDTGLDDMPGKYILPYLDQAAVSPHKIRYIVNSHADFDHTAGNASAKEMAPNAILMCHALDQAMVEDMNLIIDDRYDEFKSTHGIFESEESKAYMRASSRTLPIDMALQGGERIRLGRNWQVDILHTPGHSRGHLSFYDPRSKALIICDATLYNAVLRADGAPAFPPTYRYVETYVASMQRFQGMSLSMLLTSHYPIYTGAGINEFLAESRAYVDRVDDALRAELQSASEPRTMRSLIDALAPKLGEWPSAANAALSQPLQGHLERLVQYGQVRTGIRESLVTFEWTAA